MKRPVLLSSVVLLIVACSGTDDGAFTVPATTTIVDDSGGEAGDPMISPDGTRLAWAQVVDGASAIFVGNRDGSDPVQLTRGVWDSNPIWSPDSRMIAYLGESPDFDLFVVPSTGGEPRQLTSGPATEMPRQWLPDGTGIVFTVEFAGPVRTLVVPVDGGPAQPLLPPVDGNQWITVSPDGSRAAYSLLRGGSSTLWIQDLAGGEARQITDEGFEEGSAHMWSPDGRYVAYNSRRTGTYDLWIADISTLEVRQLTTDINNDIAPVWSPDGQWIAFLSDRGGQNDLWIVPAAGGRPLRVTDDLAIEGTVGWSPDGTTVYADRLELSRGLAVVPLDGRPPHDLIDWSGYRVESADLSPDGRTVLFESNRSGNDDLWSVPIEGGEPTPFSASPVLDERPRFSPDGSRVAFHSHRGGTGDLWVMPADGGDAVRLTDWPSDDQPLSWSPDGSLIAFASSHDAPTQELWVVRADGGEPRRLTMNQGDVSDAYWSDDSTIYFIGSTSGGSRDLFRVRLDGGAPEPLGSSPYIGEGALSPDGNHYAYASFEGGWAFIDVIATSGGPPRRLTTRTERVYQMALAWTRDGGGLVVSDLDFDNDTHDLMLVTWPRGEWSRLTQTADESEVPIEVSADGEALVTVNTDSGRVISVNVADLMAAATNR